MSPKQLLVLYIILMKMHLRAEIVCIFASLFPGIGERTPEVGKALAFTSSVVSETWLIIGIHGRVICSTACLIQYRLHAPVSLLTDSPGEGRAGELLVSNTSVGRVTHLREFPRSVRFRHGCTRSQLFRPRACSLHHILNVPWDQEEGTTVSI